MDTTVAARFVDLALSCQWWSEVEELPDNEVQVFLDVLAAGFNPGFIVPGKLKGEYLDQTGRKTGEVYSINWGFPFKVISPEKEDDYIATGWLDCALRRVVSGGPRRGESREQLVEAIEREIERSIPLEPIQLTTEGDLLCEYPPNPLAFSSLAYFVDHTQDSGKLASCVGVHMFCGGWMDRRQATATHDAIMCRNCQLKVFFPKKIKTYGGLRQFLTTP